MNTKNNPLALMPNWLLVTPTIILAVAALCLIVASRTPDYSEFEAGTPPRWKEEKETIQLVEIKMVKNEHSEQTPIFVYTYFDVNGDLQRYEAAAAAVLSFVPRKERAELIAELNDDFPGMLEPGENSVKFDRSDSDQESL